MTHIADGHSLEDMINSADVVVLEFSATWCGPCKMLRPVIERLSTDYVDVSFWDIDIEKNPDMSEKADISSLPTVRVYCRGEMIGESHGFAPLQIRSLLKKALGRLEND